MRVSDWLERGRAVLQSGRAALEGGRALASGAAGAVRRTEPLPALLTPWLPRGPADTMPKPTPANLRRFAETPVARRAINVIKDRIAAMDWQVRLKRSFSQLAGPDSDARAAALVRSLEMPNPGDSFRSLLEQALEDTLVGGFGAVEMQLTGRVQQPVELWPVDGASIQVNAAWNGSADEPRYAQMTSPGGTNTAVPLHDDELMYVRLNPRSYTPFGLGRLEVAFESVNAFLGAHRYAGKLAANQVVQYALWLNEATPEQHERLIRWWQDEIEGTGRVPVLSTEQKPEVIRFANGTDADLRLGWQQFLLRMVANAFDLPPMYLGLDFDVNQSTAGQLADEAFRSTIAPTARLIAEHITRDVFGKRLGWDEFEFLFNDLEARNELEELQIQTELLKAGVLSVAEVRAMRGLGAQAAGPAEANDGDGEDGDDGQE